MRNQILIVDDSKFNRDMLKSSLKNMGGYQFVEAENGKIAMEYIAANEEKLAAVTLDIVMPEMDGVTVLRTLNDKNLMQNFPVIVITSEQPSEIVEDCFDLGIADFIRKPIRAELIEKRVKKQTELYLQRNEFKSLVERQTMTVKNQYALLQKQAAKLEKQNDAIITMLGTVVEFRDMGDESKHIENVRQYTQILADQYVRDYPDGGLDKTMAGRIAAASVMHDIGKIFIPESILLKPGKLTSDEYDMVKSHTLRGCESLERLDFEWDKEFFNICYDVCRSHHEKYDGSGYPDGLKEDQIPLAAQFVSIADTFDVMTTERIYKQASSPELAFQKIISGECGMFSPKLMECLRNAKGLFVSYCEKVNAEEA